MDPQAFEQVLTNLLENAAKYSSKDIENRVKEHFDAGADHVCVQPINPNGKAGDIHWECLNSLISLN